MNDDRLRTAFAELREAETAHVPPFQRLWGRRGRRPYTRWAFAVVLLVVVAVSIVPLVRRRPVEPSISTWHAPTDFLLQTPGRELLETVPDLKGNTP